jgi:hypothetical protein
VGEHHRAAKVDREGAIDLFQGERREPTGRRDARVGDQDVDVAGLVGQALRLAGARQVGRYDARIAELVRQLAQRVFVPRREDEPCAFAS